MSLTGFTTLDEQTVHETIQQTWATPAMCDKIITTIQNKDPQHPNISHLRNNIKNFISMVQVERIDTKMFGSVLTPRFNILSNNPPSSNPYAWTDLRIILTSLQYHTPMDGTGTSLRLTPCAICHSYSHPTGLCPFPKIPGWNGPTPRQRGSTTPIRSQGRPRGSNYRTSDYY